MHIHTYFITLAENKEDAESNVVNWIDDHYDKEFYDYGGLDEGETTFLLQDVLNTLKESRDYTENVILPAVIEDMEHYKETGNRSLEGYSHIRYGNILSEDFCADMPYFNIDDWYWTIPSEVPKEAEGCQWYAIKVDLHY